MDGFEKGLDAVKDAERKRQVMIDFDRAHVRVNNFENSLRLREEGASVFWVLKRKIQGKYDIGSIGSGGLFHSLFIRQQQSSSF